MTENKPPVHKYDINGKLTHVTTFNKSGEATLWVIEREANRSDWESLMNDKHE